jgi:cell wall-associated NlpC family hydrolase
MVAARGGVGRPGTFGVALALVVGAVGAVGTAVGLAAMATVPLLVAGDAGSAPSLTGLLDPLDAAASSSGEAAESSRQVTIVGWAVRQVGTPYVWGGESPGVGFDCSGLVQAAYRVAGIELPRVAQDQYDSSAKLSPLEPLRPGDPVFFGTAPSEVTHVGIYLGILDGQATMVDAPHRGADVRVDAFGDAVGHPWGADRYLGATRPLTG